MQLDGSQMLKVLPTRTNNNHWHGQPHEPQKATKTKEFHTLLKAPFCHRPHQIHLGLWMAYRFASPFRVFIKHCLV